MHFATIQTSEIIIIESDRYSIILGAIEYCLLVILVQVETAKHLQCILI